MAGELLLATDIRIANKVAACGSLGIKAFPESANLAVERVIILSQGAIASASLQTDTKV
jgi:hypothetical protein